MAVTIAEIGGHDAGRGSRTRSATPVTMAEMAGHIRRNTHHATERVVLVMNGAGWHRSGDVCWPANVRSITLPAYSPEFNPVEHLWDELREKHVHNRFFDSLSAVEEQLESALRGLELDAERVQSITAWQWIVDSLPN